MGYRIYRYIGYLEFPCNFLHTTVENINFDWTLIHVYMKIYVYFNTVWPITMKICTNLWFVIDNLVILLNTIYDAVVAIVTTKKCKAVPVRTVSWINNTVWNIIDLSIGTIRVLVTFISIVWRAVTVLFVIRPMVLVGGRTRGPGAGARPALAARAELLAHAASWNTRHRSHTPPVTRTGLNTRSISGEGIFIFNGKFDLIYRIELLWTIVIVAKLSFVLDLYTLALFKWIYIYSIFAI